RRSHLVDLLEFSTREPHHARTAVWIDAQPAVRLELAKCFANRGKTSAESRGPRFRPNPPPRTEFSAGDGLAEGLLHILVLRLVSSGVCHQTPACETALLYDECLSGVALRQPADSSDSNISYTEVRPFAPSSPRVG